jgi:hypothetical protein
MTYLALNYKSDNKNGNWEYHLFANGENTGVPHPARYGITVTVPYKHGQKKIMIMWNEPTLSVDAFSLFCARVEEIDVIIRQAVTDFKSRMRQGFWIGECVQLFVDDDLKYVLDKLKNVLHSKKTDEKMQHYTKGCTNIYIGIVHHEKKYKVQFVTEHGVQTIDTCSDSKTADDVYQRFTQCFAKFWREKSYEFWCDKKGIDEILRDYKILNPKTKESQVQGLQRMLLMGKDPATW